MLTQDELESAVAFAVLAPSLHNTQPWLFSQDGDSVVVRADTSRWLREQDPIGRELLISCGGAVRHLVLGLRVQGLDLRWELLPRPDLDPDEVAVVTVTGRRPASAHDQELGTAASLRHTDRSRFSETPLASEVLDRMRQLAEREGCFLDVLDDDDVLELAVLTEHADRLLREDATTRGEQDRWTSDLARPAEGVPADALPDHGARRGSPVRLRDFLTEPAEPAGPAGEPPPAEHPTLVVLGTESDDRRAWIRCGWTLSELLLTLTCEGLVASPLTQALEVPGLRTRLRAALGLQGNPQMVLRLGHPGGPGSPQTGRRSIGEVLC